jgi:hypothetical protein
MDQAKKSVVLSKNVSLLEDQVSALKSIIAQLDDGDKYMTKILERACEQLKCKFLGALEYFSTQVYADIVALDVGTCLDAAAEDLRGGVRVIVLERVSAGTDPFWSDAQRHQAVVLLQDRVDHIERTVGACRKALMTTLTVTLPINPPPDNFRKLLDAFV